MKRLKHTTALTVGALAFLLSFSTPHAQTAGDIDTLLQVVQFGAERAVGYRRNVEDKTSPDLNEVGQVTVDAILLVIPLLKEGAKFIPAVEALSLLNDFNKFLVAENEFRAALRQGNSDEITFVQVN